MPLSSFAEVASVCHVPFYWAGSPVLDTALPLPAQSWGEGKGHLSPWASNIMLPASCCWLPWPQQRFSHGHLGVGTRNTRSFCFKTALQLVIPNSCWCMGLFLPMLHAYVLSFMWFSFAVFSSLLMSFWMAPHQPPSSSFVLSAKGKKKLKINRYVYILSLLQFLLLAISATKSYEN